MAAAALSLRLRRALSASASLLQRRPLSTAPSPIPLSRPRAPAAALLYNLGLLSRPHNLAQSLAFHSSAPCSIRGGSGAGEDSKIGPDEILFEGCDYNHWLITMDFPKDPKPTPGEMVETYVQTAAKVVGSVEEAKKRIYACSTTTYEGFQLVCDEETSEKFRGLPGVVFILPDSYIDPVNKEYGGDKYDNGVITPRPPPIQYGRRGRYNDRNRNYDRPRYDRPRDSMPMQQGNQPFDQQGPMQGDGRNYGPQQNYGPPGPDGRGYNPPPPPGGMNYAPRQNYGPPGQDGRGYNAPPPPGGRNYAPQQNYGPPGGNYPQQNYGPPGGNYAAGGRDGYQGDRRDPMPSFQQGFNQGETRAYRNAGPPGAGDHGQGSTPAYGGDYRQGSGPGYTGGNRQGMTSNYGGDHRQGLGSDNQQGYSGPVEGQTESWQGRN